MTFCSQIRQVGLEQCARAGWLQCHRPERGGEQAGLPGAQHLALLAADNVQAPSICGKDVEALPIAVEDVGRGEVEAFQCKMGAGKGKGAPVGAFLNRHRRDLGLKARLQVNAFHSSVGAGLTFRLAAGPGSGWRRPMITSEFCMIS